jgi:uncharacterized protein YecE (DUF72 family)
VYPPGTPAKDYLQLYAQLFPMTELNFSYYRQPDPRMLERMAHVTGDEFRFSIKAHKSLTHEVTTGYRAEAATFKEGIAPLVEASKLCAILFQFPYSFHYTPQNRTYLRKLCDEFAGLPVAVEFRTSEWQRDSVYRGLKERSVAYVNVDEPPMEKLPTPTAVVSAPLAYVRFHGRNAQQWWQGDNASRYNYLYSEQQLMEWVPRIEQLATQAVTVVVAFNNHWRGQAAQNAREMKELIMDNG